MGFVDLQAAPLGMKPAALQSHPRWPGGIEGVRTTARLSHSKVQRSRHETGHFYPNNSNLRSFTCMRKELWYVGYRASAVLLGREGNSLDLPFISDKDTAFEAIANCSWHSRPWRTQGEFNNSAKVPRASSRLGLQPRLRTLSQHQITPLLEISLLGKAPSARGTTNPQPTSFLLLQWRNRVMCWLMLPLTLCICDLSLSQQYKGTQKTGWPLPKYLP